MRIKKLKKYKLIIRRMAAITVFTVKEVPRSLDSNWCLKYFETAHPTANDSKKSKTSVQPDHGLMGEK